MFPNLRTGKPRRERGMLTVGEGLEMPFGLVEGAKPGPRLVVTAGIHGSEFCSIEAAQRLLAMTPDDIAGTLLVLPIVNLEAFRKRSIYIVPADGKNLNRVFPGRADGSASERLAHWLVTNAYAQADAYVDLHGGDLNEALVPFVIYPDGDERAKEMALLFGLPNVIASQAKGFSISAASARGVPAILAEVSGNGLWDDSLVLPLVDGVKRVMQLIGMRAGQVAMPRNPPLVQTLTFISSPVDGLWYPSQRIGAKVTSDQTLGEVRDLMGERLVVVKAPTTGTVLFQMTSLSVNAGEALLGIVSVRSGG
jgi:predicted deacylase